MIRVILFLAAILALATGLSWLADRPGNIAITWEGYDVTVSVFHAVVVGAIALAVAALAWSLVRQLWNGPASVGDFMNRRRQARGLEALSSGMIAVGAGDRATATRYAIAARKSLPNEPLTHLLRAQAAQLSGDKATSRRIFESMLSSPDTEQLGLRGLFLEAQREKETEAARHFAESAVKLNPKLAWASDALFDIQCRSSDWEAALETLAIARRNNLIEKGVADRRRAVLLTGQAVAAQDQDPNKSLALAIEAHGLAPDLVPAASLAGRMLASKGSTPKAAKILQKTWARNPHPDLATAYAFARIGDSPRDRLDRIKQLAALNPQSAESAIAVANAAIDAREFDEARRVVEPLTDGRLTQRIATLMARIESEQHGDKGRVREWLARAVNAPRDPVWTADGMVSDHWAPVSPVTGALDAFQWRVAVENVAGGDHHDVLTRKTDELVALGAPNTDTTFENDLTTTNEMAQARQTSPVKPGPRRVADVTDVEPVDTAHANSAAQPGPVRSSAASASAPKGSSQIAPTSTQPSKPQAVTAPAVTTMSSRTVVPTTNSGTQPSQPKPSQLQATQIKPTSPSTSINSTSSKSVEVAGKEPRVFVVPHAPDDPGPEEGELDVPHKGPRKPYRAVP
jgi:HemY protein